MDQHPTYRRISIYPMDQTAEKRRRLMETLDDLGIKYTYEAY